MAEKNIGKITQVISAVLDIKFSEGKLPEINEAIDIDNNGNKHWMEKEFTNDESKTFFEICFEQITSLMPD